MNHQPNRNRVADELLGDKCSICGGKQRLTCHEKNGVPHTQFSRIGAGKFRILLEHGNFVRVCFICHKHVHWCMKSFGFSWDEIVERIRIGKELVRKASAR